MTELLATSMRFALSGGAYTVEFLKSDGTVREMVCTTKHSLIAATVGRDLSPAPIEAGRPKDSDLITAYDLQNLGWRSFYASKVQSFEPFLDPDGTHATDPW